MQLQNETRLFLYQLVGTWGQLLFPKPWKEFRLWYDTHKSKGIKPYLRGMVTNGWYKKMGERIWTPWFIMFIHTRGYFNIYTNFQHERALSVSHRDAGVNYGRTVGPDSYLLDESSLDFNLAEMQSTKTLKLYNFCFKEVYPGRIVRSFNELGSILHSLQKEEIVMLVSLFGVPTTIVRNLICHFERLNIRNYIFFGSNSDFLLDLARRGHPVIDADQFFDSIKTLRDLQSSSKEMIKEILVKAYVIKKCLESGYSSWLVNGNMLVNSTNFYFYFNNPAYDFFAGKNIEFFFARSSSSTRKIWVDKFLHEAETMVGSLVSKSSLPRDGTSFVYVMTKLIEQKGTKVLRIDEASISMKIDTDNVGQALHGARGMIFFWSSNTIRDLIQKRLEELGMWIINGDSSCMAVICHQS